MTKDRILTNGKTEEEMPDYRDESHDGLQKAYVVLTEEERAKGFVRPVRRTYVHSCGVATTMAQAIAETYARDPKFYTGTYCVGCKKHVLLTECKWDGTNEEVGS